MERDIKVNLEMIKKMEWEFIIGQMEKYKKDYGKMINLSQK